ncbi:MAG: hypothetical protein IJS32_05665 [Kiritimatiellae bacterium]|nr:hypothetical protein [Kiritimatiellia bacterium]
MTGRRNRGSVLMEYVVLCGAVMLLIDFIWRMGLYNPTEGWDTILGRPIEAYYQRVLGGIALPIP